jgi:SAM-dependent methyltransferase
VSETPVASEPQTLAAPGFERPRPPSWRDEPRARLRHARKVAKLKWFRYVIKGRLGATNVRNLVTDLRYGGYAGGARDTGHWSEGMLGFSSTDYRQLARVFDAANGLEIRPEDILVDVGCGKGRVINWWLGRGLGNRIYGIEIDEKLAESARRRLARWPNVSIVTGDALESLPPDATILFLFNPFWWNAVELFKERLVEVYGEDSPVRIVYFMPVFGSVFEDDPRFVVERARTKTVYSCLVIRFARARAGLRETGP